MEVQLQELIEQIKKDGVAVAETEAKDIVDAAKADAEKIIAEARAQADKIMSDAKTENERTVKSGEEAIRQAGRNPLISFRESVAKEISAIIGENVSSIGRGAFNGCSSLQNVTCLAINPPALGDNAAFPYPNIATLKVPCGSLEDYSSATSFWNMFFAGRISENGYNVEVSVNDETFGSVAVESDCSTGTITATANEGYRFVIWNDGNTDNPRTVALTSDTAFTAIFALIDESSLLEAEIEEISFFPNPTKSEITFSQAIEKVEVIDLIGKAILTFTNAKTINIESLPAGAYYLRLTNDEKTIMQKVIKQ